MKKLLYMFVVGTFAMFQSCQGPQGPEGPLGPQGPQGQQGPPGQGGGNGLIATVYEIEPVNLNAANEYSIFFEYPTVIEPSDKVITYLLWEVDDDEDVWRMMPQTVFVEQGIFKYDFDFTRFDVRFFMEGNFDLVNLGTEWTDEVVFRVVVIPADFPAGRMDYSNMEEVLKHFDITKDDIIKGEATIK